MNNKNSAKTNRQIKLTVKKETLKDLSTDKTVVGGILMKDTIIVRPTR